MSALSEDMDFDIPDSGRRRLLREFSSLRTNPLEGIAVDLDNDDIYHWRVEMMGPAGSVYEGGIFKLTLHFHSSFPELPPIAQFTSSMFHPNIDEEGRVCFNVLTKWDPATTIESTLIQIQVLLANPNPDSPFNSFAAFIYKNWRQRYDELVHGCVEKSLLEL